MPNLPKEFEVEVTMDYVVTSLRAGIDGRPAGECYSSMCPVALAVRAQAPLPKPFLATIGSHIIVIRKAITTPSSTRYDGGDAAAMITNMFDAKQFDKLREFLPKKVKFTLLPT